MLTFAIWRAPKDFLAQKSMALIAEESCVFVGVLLNRYREKPVGAQRVEGPLSTAGAGVGGWSIRWSTCGVGGEDGGTSDIARSRTWETS